LKQSTSVYKSLLIFCKDRTWQSAVDGRTKRHEGDETSLKVRKRLEEAFGWIRTVGGLGKTQPRG
jgi:hypothetical protein